MQEGERVVTRRFEPVVTKDGRPQLKPRKPAAAKLNTAALKEIASWVNRWYDALFVSLGALSTSVRIDLAWLMATTVLVLVLLLGRRGMGRGGGAVVVSLSGASILSEKISHASDRRPALNA